MTRKIYNLVYGAQDFLGLNDRARAARRFGSAIVVGLGATIPIMYFSWWMAYRSGWFE